MLRCCLSGQVPKRPVVTPRGYVYEREAIESYVDRFGKDPMDHGRLEIADLVDLKVETAMDEPARLRSTGFPGLLEEMQRQWNDLVEELHATREKLGEAQKELATALYENEAAKRVIARLLENGAREEIPQHVESVEERLRAFVAKRSTERAQSNRVNRGVADIIMERMKAAVYTREGAMEGIRCVVQDGDQVVIGTADGCVNVLDGRTLQVVRSIKCEDVPIGSIDIQAGNMLVRQGDDCRVLDGENTRTMVLQGLVEAFLHPMGDLMYVFYNDGTWRLMNTELEVCLEGKAEGMIETVAVHPDGFMFALVCQDAIDIWMADRKSLVLRLAGPAGTRDVRFSPNGKLLAALGEEEIRVWYLGDTNQVVSVYGKASVIGFDCTGNVLFAGGQQAKAIQISTDNNTMQIFQETVVDKAGTDYIVATGEATAAFKMDGEYGRISQQ